MRPTVSTEFATPERAEEVAQDLIRAGVDPNDISVVPVTLAPEHDPPIRVHGGPSGRMVVRGARTPKRGGFYGILIGAAAGVAVGWLGAQIPLTVGAFTAMTWGLGIGAFSGWIAGMVMNGDLGTVTDLTLSRPHVHGHTAVRVRPGSMSVDEIRALFVKHEPMGFDPYTEDLDVRERVAEATGEPAPKGIVAGTTP